MSQLARNSEGFMRASQSSDDAGAAAVHGCDGKTRLDAWLQSPRNEHARRAFLADIPILNPLQQRLLTELRDFGVTHAAFTDLAGDQSEWRVLAREIHTWLHSAEMLDAEAAFHAIAPAKRGKEDYLFRQFRRQGEQVTLPWSCPWLQVALEPRILDVVNHYFVLMSHLYHLDLWATFADAREAPRVSAQNWHRDRMDLRLVKAFLYFSDVDLDSGALQYVPNSRIGDDKFGSVWTPEQHKGGYPPSEEFNRRIPEADWVTCAHPAGTLVLVDTTGYHCGGRALTHNRVFATWAYGSQATVSDRFVVDLESVPADLSEAARFALFRRSSDVDSQLARSRGGPS